MNAYDVVDELEKRVAAYGGSKYAVAVDSCSNALLISIAYRISQGYVPEANIPKLTYVGVAQALLNAGCKITFRDEDWQGAYWIAGLDIVDSARRFTRNMYRGREDMLYCLSAHWGKHLKIGRGGFILTNDKDAADMLKRMRFDGRTVGIPPKNDSFVRGYHCYMLPEEASRGLMLMSYMPDVNADLPRDDYADLSKCEIFQ